MTTHDLMRSWLASGDPAQVAHARYRLTHPDVAIPEPVACRHRHPIPGCACYHCALFARKAPAELCAECERIEQ